MSSSSKPASRLAVAATALALAGAAAVAADDYPPKPFESQTMNWRFTGELGYRTVDLTGNEELYRSHTNVDSGIRLFGFSLIGTPKGGDSGSFMDSMELTAGGLGGDPQEWVRFSMRKRGVYRWDVNFNQSDYFFNVPDFVRFGQHTNKNDRRSFDTTLEMTPGKTRVYVGLARRDFEGPTFSTQDFARDEFRIMAPVDRETREVRAGIDFKVARWTFGIEESYRMLSSTSDFLFDPNSSGGNNPGGSTLTAFHRRVPLEGNYWITRASANAAFADRVDLSLRLVYSKGDTEGTSNQTASGTWFTTGNPAFTETVTGRFDSDLPSSLAEVGVSIRLTDAVYLHNNIRFHDYQIDGETQDDLNRVGADPNISATSSESFERLVEWTSWEARSEVEWRLNNRFTLRGGFRRLDRDVKLEAHDDGVLVDEEDAGQTADTVFGTVAFRWDRKWSAFLEYWDGEVDNVFLRVNPSDTQLVRLHGSYKPTDRWSVNLSTSYRHAENPTPDFANTVDSRTYAISTDFAGKALSFSAGYTGVNLDSSTDISFCIASSCSAALGTQVSDVSLWQFADSHYFANGSYLFAGRFRASLRGQVTDSRDTFPVDYYFVEPRVSLRLRDGWWANLGWYRYEFDRGQDNVQDYRAEGAVISLSGEF